MRRYVLVPLTVTLLWMLCAQEAFAQSGGQWSAFPLKQGWSGPGFYLSLGKLITCWLTFLLWVYTTDWVSRDAQETKMGYQRWNPIVFGVFLGALVLSWLLPSFWIGYPLLFLAYVAPLTTYILLRNKKMPAHERVMTPDHLRHWFAERASLLGMKIKTEREDPHTTGAPVILTAKGGATERDDNAHLLLARQAPGFDDARHMLADALFRRADAMMLDYTQQNVGLRFMVDGVWHNGEPWMREQGDPALEALKILGGLNSQDRQNRQEGIFAAEYKAGPVAEKYSVNFVSQGTPAGERVVMQFEGRKAPFATLESLGMRSKMEEQLKELLALPHGIVLFSAMPANGLRTLTTVTLKNTDRFTREFMALEEEKNRYEPIENIPVTVYSAGQSQTAAATLGEMLHQEPNVVVIRDLPDAELVSLMAQEMERERLFISTIRAKDAAEALLRVLALKVPPQEFAGAVVGVLNQRLIRKLCEYCKEAYAPPPQVLQQLGIPEGRIQAFYRPRQPTEENPDICPECGGIGYTGRTAIFELLIVNDTIRKILATNPKLDLLRQAARKAGMRSLQEEGIVLVAKGTTSLPELLRVMKQ
jgi:type II secretory ATPase GspE/PulE/Tfp pilus assembly ATPase PilB-like protein